MHPTSLRETARSPRGRAFLQASVTPLPGTLPAPPPFPSHAGGNELSPLRGHDRRLDRGHVRADVFEHLCAGPRAVQSDAAVDGPGHGGDHGGRHAGLHVGHVPGPAAEPDHPGRRPVSLRLRA